MKSLLIATAWLLLLAAPAAASLVIHDGDTGIVAMEDNGSCLDRDGHVWGLTNGGAGGWTREGLEPYDPPVPVENIKFWAYNRFVTMDDEGWIYMGPGVWQNFGTWPASSIPEAPTVVATARVAPNPAPGSCTISFYLAAPGPVSVSIFDVAGRQVRTLLRSELPVGTYSPTWDGRGDDAAEVPTGVYFAEITNSEGRYSLKVTLTR